MSEDRAWSIMTKSHGGTVSVIRDLTLAECRATYERLDPWYGEEFEQRMVHKDYALPDDGPRISFAVGGCGRTAHDGDIEVREVFGPPGWDRNEVRSWDYWPKSRTVWTDDKGHVLEPQPPAPQSQDGTQHE